jgi:MFS family permease
MWDKPGPVPNLRTYQAGMTGSLGFRGFIAAISAVCGIVAGILGGWLTGHWQWGVAFAFLIMIAIVAITEFHKTMWEDGQIPRDHDYPGPTTSAGVRVGAAMLTVLASLGCAGGVLYYVQHVTSAHHPTRQGTPGTTSPKPAAVLAAAGGHDSPAAAVSGFIGDSLLGAYKGLCGYYLPSEQDWCLQHEPHGRAESGSAAIGEVVVHGTRAIVAVVGRICVLKAPAQSGPPCLSNSSPYISLSRGTSFAEAFNKASMASYRGLMWSCEEVHGAWYVAFTKLS